MQALPTAYLIEPPLILRSLYELASIVFSSEGLAHLSTGDERDEFDKLRVRHEVSQATKLLIEIAVVLRNLLDGGNWPMDVIHENRIERRPEMEVGILRSQGEEHGLSFREACNKLIHAQRMSFGMKELPGIMQCLDGSVELHGSKGRHAWEVRLQLAHFIRMAVRQV